MRLFIPFTIACALAAVLLTGCPAEKKPSPPSPPAPQLTGLPIEMTVKQRSTTAIPGSKAAVSLTIDDITRGQVMASLAKKEGAVLLAPTSLTAGASAAFKLGDQSYHLQLQQLNNELIGDDSATFVISDSPPADGAVAGAAPAEAEKPLSDDAEAERINLLLEHVASLNGAVFIRNAAEHTPAEAVEHLQRKWEAAAGEITTAEQFIDRLATKSSLTGKPYTIRLKDGTETPAGEYLHQRLAELERQRPQ